MVFNLDSVGSVIDSNDGIVYPKLCDGEYDVLCGTHLSEVDIEWINGLSSSDREFLDLLFDIDNEPKCGMDELVESLSDKEAEYWEMKAEVHFGL
jgi:hypothetical protein